MIKIYFLEVKHKNKKKSYVMNMPDPLTDFKIISKKKILDKYKIKNKQYFILPNQYRKHKNHILALKALELIARKFLEKKNFNSFNWSKS